ncbi:MAG: phosphoribosylanthranilate isomerase [Thermoanaerobaculia bacterium]|nr:phosphoribosylanthranilate isomerase [Thermoanaerobaculia bacterium]
MRPAIKICGVTRPGDARLAVELGAAYIGLNFYAGSPRCVSHRQARRIADEVAGECRLVAVVAGATRRDVAAILDEVGPDLVQFHGDERWSDIEPFAERAIKVLRVDERPEPRQLAEFAGVWGFLLDARHEDLLGGTGESWSWSRVGDLADGRPIFLAGGIRPENVRAAAATGADAIDVCSGVESAPGRKDRRLLERLFEELNRASA